MALKRAPWLALRPKRIKGQAGALTAGCRGRAEAPTKRQAAAGHCSRSRGCAPPGSRLPEVHASMRCCGSAARCDGIRGQVSVRRVKRPFWCVHMACAFFCTGSNLDGLPALAFARLRSNEPHWRHRLEGLGRDDARWDCAPNVNKTRGSTQKDTPSPLPAPCQLPFVAPRDAEASARPSAAGLGVPLPFLTVRGGRARGALAAAAARGLWRSAAVQPLGLPRARSAHGRRAGPP